MIFYALLISFKLKLFSDIFLFIARFGLLLRKVMEHLKGDSDQICNVNFLCNGGQVRGRESTIPWQMLLKFYQKSINRFFKKIYTHSLDFLIE